MNKILSFKDYSEIYINPRRTKSETDISCKKHNNNTSDYDYNSDYEYDEYDFFVNVETPFQIQNNTNKSKNIEPVITNTSNVNNIKDINDINDTEIDNIIIKPQPFSYKNILNSLYLKLLVPVAIIFFLY
jgi:hypothetical protein